MVPSLSSHVAGVPGFPSLISSIVFCCVEYLASPRVHRWALGFGLQQRVRGTWGDSRLLDLSSSTEPCTTGNVCFLHTYPFPVFSVASLDHGGNDSWTVCAEAPGSVPHCYTSLHGSWLS